MRKSNNSKKGKPAVKRLNARKQKKMNYNTKYCTTLLNTRARFVQKPINANPRLKINQGVVPRTLLCYISIRDTCMLRGDVSIAPRLSINTCVFVISESGVPERIKY